MNIKEISMAFKNVDKEIQKEREQQESHGYFDNVHITDDFTPEAKADIERKKLLALKKQQELLKKQNEPNYIIQEFMNERHNSLDTSRDENYNLGQELIEENASSEQTNSELKQELADMMNIDEESLEQIINEMEISEDAQENNEYNNKESDTYNDLTEEDYDDYIETHIEPTRNSRSETVVKLQSNKLNIEDTDRITVEDEIESKMDSLLNSIESFGNTVVMGDSLSDIKRQMLADMEDNGVEINGTNIFKVDSLLEDNEYNEDESVINNEDDENELYVDDIEDLDHYNDDEDTYDNYSYNHQQKENNLDYKNDDYEDDEADDATNYENNYNKTDEQPYNIDDDEEIEHYEKNDATPANTDYNSGDEDVEQYYEKYDDNDYSRKNSCIKSLHREVTNNSKHNDDIHKEYKYDSCDTKCEQSEELDKGIEKYELDEKYTYEYDKYNYNECMENNEIESFELDDSTQTEEEYEHYDLTDEQEKFGSSYYNDEYSYGDELSNNDDYCIETFEDGYDDFDDYTDDEDW